MSPDDDIESWLKAYARRRREAAGDSLQLHPVQRRQLHDEVRRVYGRAQPEPAAKPWWWFLVRPRFALGAGLCALLAMALVYSLNLGQREKDLAYREADPEAEAAPPEDSFAPLPSPADSNRARLERSLPPTLMTVQPPPAPAATPSTDMTPAPSSSQPAPRPLVVQPATQLDMAERTTRPEPGAPSVTPSAALGQDRPAIEERASPRRIADPSEFDSQDNRAFRSLSEAPPAALGRQGMADATVRATVPATTALPREIQASALAPEQAATSPAGAGNARGMQVVGRWSFVRPTVTLDAIAVPVSGEREVFQAMKRFEFETTAQGVLIRDQDGSLYRGEWVLANSGPAQASALQYRFRAAGTNATTGQKVSFEGDLAWLPQTAEAREVESTDPSPVRMRRRFPAETRLGPSPSLTGGWWIQGALEVGGQEAQDIRAHFQPVMPESDEAR